MYTETLEIMSVILAGIIALIALSIAGYPRMLELFYYLYFPPARFNFKANKGIEKLRVLNEESTNLKRGRLNIGEMGFKELNMVLKEDWGVDEPIEGIILSELRVGAGMFTMGIALTPQTPMSLAILKNGRETQIQQEVYDPSRIIRDLKDSIDRLTRKKVGNWLAVIICIYVILGIILVVIR